MSEFEAEVARLAALHNLNHNEVVRLLDAGLTRALHEGLPCSVFSAIKQRQRERLGVVRMARKGDCV